MSEPTKPIEALTTALFELDGYGVDGMPEPDGDRLLWYRGEAFEVIRRLKGSGFYLEALPA